MIFTLLIVFLMFVSTQIVFASSFNIFGGKIAAIEASDIQELEDFGYECDIPGISTSIVPIGSPSGTPIDYLIPYGVTSKTGTMPRIGQLILGSYSGEEIVECINAESEDVQTVVLNTITLFATSR